MKTRLSFLFLSVFLSVLFVSNRASLCFEIITTTETVMVQDVEVEVIRTADNFIILYDASASMNAPYKDTGMKKIEVQKQIIKDQHEKLPDLHFNAGLYAFAPAGKGMTFKSLQPYYEMQPYFREEFAKAIDSLPTEGGGPTLLQGGLGELNKVLEGLTGHTVIFVFTDGRYLKKKNLDTPLAIAQKYAQKYDVTFYVISSAPDEATERMLHSVASINESSRVIPFDSLVGRPEYATGALYIVKENIVNRLEEQEVEIGVKLKDVLFTFGEEKIRPEFHDQLDKIGKFLSENPDAYVILSGFSDYTGESEYNLMLSRRRAEAVADYLMTNFNISKDTIITLWYGEANPVSDNSTKQGRMENRRVEIIISKQ